MIRLSKQAKDRKKEIPDELYVYAYNLFIQNGDLIDEEVAQKTLKENGKTEKIDYALLKEAHHFWQNIIAPDTLAVCRKYKKILVDAKKSAQESGFSYDDIYFFADLQADSGATKLYFFGDGSDWYESSFPGMEYDTLEEGCLDMISYRKKGFGYFANPIHGDWLIFPRIDTDEWGSFFTIWKWSENKEANYVVGMDFQADSIYAMMLRNAKIIGLIIFVDLILVIFVSVIMTRKITEPIKKLSQKTAQLVQEDFSTVIEPCGPSEFRQLFADTDVLAKWGLQKNNQNKFIRETFSPEIADILLKDGLEIGYHQQDSTFFLSDIGGWNTLSALLNNVEAAGASLNTYFNISDHMIRDNSGHIDKHTGDGVMALFGVPKHYADHATKAVLTAIKIQKIVRKFNDERRGLNLPCAEFRIGINSGKAMVGQLGSDVKKEYTAIGSNVNKAARLEAVCPLGKVLISMSTYSELDLSQFVDVKFEGPMEIETKDGVANCYMISVNNLLITKKEDPKSPAGNDFYNYE